MQQFKRAGLDCGSQLKKKRCKNLLQKCQTAPFYADELRTRWFPNAAKEKWAPARYILIDSVIFVRGLWTTKQGLKGNWPSGWQVTDTLGWGSLILLLSLHEAYITNYNAYRVIYHLMDLLFFFSFSFSEPWEQLESLDYRLQVLCSLNMIKTDDVSRGTKLSRSICQDYRTE